MEEKNQPLTGMEPWGFGPVADWQKRLSGL